MTCKTFLKASITSVAYSHYNSLLSVLSDSTVKNKPYCCDMSHEENKQKIHSL